MTTRYRSGLVRWNSGCDELIRPAEDWMSRLPRFWIILQLLAYPGIARRIVAKTIENYALPESATEAIKRLPVDSLS